MKKVIVGLSGGVDSAVAAYLLKKEGFEVIGLHVKTWHETEEDRKRALENIDDVRRIAEALQIPLRIADFSDTFFKCVVSDFVNEYKKGRTPNPCLNCNRDIKWGALIEEADREGIEYIATGHYANIVKNENNRYTIMTDPDNPKDQAYALSRISQAQLSRTIMPLYGHKKEEIREIAERIGLPVAKKGDSQDICFIPDGDHTAFLKRMCPEAFSIPGVFTDASGRVLAPSDNVLSYTIGQRKGLGIAAGHPVYVLSVCPEKNRVIVGENEQLFSTVLYADRVVYSQVSQIPEEGLMGTAKIRYAHKGTPCRVYNAGHDRIRVEFSEPVRAVTPGQTVVVFGEKTMLLSGIIENEFEE